MSAPLAQAAPETLIEVALLVWYDPDPLPSLKRVLDALEGVELRRALYVLDRLRRFDCMGKQRYCELADLVKSPRWEPLKVSFVPLPPHWSGQPDWLAQGWGLAEYLNTKIILPYQTRHYAAERRKGVN
ncbi:hypothetical protein [Pseudomonas aeruginosa]|uniref:hypothetical protein n=1 Tax=Pseudomonas aeruginosa TaxID=287 RepID=UPI000AFF3538|nr:hypothetical protein [Pseudomonas aeruginosa]WGY38218.1 hypothetical protein LGV63_02855 [Pseudomonas aeruginosa]HEP9751790.1 hypothetical protein [Pseudomonas aeruginosa]